MATRYFATRMAGEQQLWASTNHHHWTWAWGGVGWKTGGTTVAQIHFQFPWTSSIQNQHAVYLAPNRPFLMVDVPSPARVHQNCPRYLRFRDCIQADLGQAMVVLVVVVETARLSSYSRAYEAEADSSLGTSDGTRIG